MMDHPINDEQQLCKHVGIDSQGIWTLNLLWLSSDVGKLLQVMDVTCMGYGELDHIHGCGGHG